MPTEAPEVRVTDSKARLTLPKSFANATLLIEQISDVEIVIRKAKVVPLAPSGDLQPDPSPRPLSPTDWALFLSLLDNPPPPNAALKKAFARRKKRLEAKTRPE